ncbi:unnamed protein product [Cladocopium goreaui]|uniref:Uncharacterized protein F23F12.8 n=1 Tax=Cladocopium goreaui TaxID=2562237 RepID=A0A9P1DVI6_9DINO|nr:unnamed protein product [Cladocopium goreaui]
MRRQLLHNLLEDNAPPEVDVGLGMPKMQKTQRLATFFVGDQQREHDVFPMSSRLAQERNTSLLRKHTFLASSFQEKQVVCAINMRERYPGMRTKRCCEEPTESSCLACCQDHFAYRGDKCIEVCNTMCSFGWDKSNHKVPQCPEKLGSESGGAEEWYAEDPMKDRPRPAVPDKKADEAKKAQKALELGL